MDTIDITAPLVVDVSICEDGTVLRVNVDGVCRLRICQIEAISVEVLGRSVSATIARQSVRASDKGGWKWHYATKLLAEKANRGLGLDFSEHK